MVEAPAQLQDAQPDAVQPAPAIAAAALAKRIDERPILRDVSFELKAGEFVAVLGANGSGKSTLLKILATLLPPTAGRLQLFGEPAGPQSHHLRRRIGMIGHEPMLYRDLSARENLEFFGRLYGLAEPAARARQMLECVGLANRSNDAVRTFSRGMVQRVSIARALLHQPDLILADEPFAGLDDPSAEALEQLFEQVHDAGKTIVMVNHDIDQSLRMAGRALVLRGGQIAVDQPTHRLYPRELRAEVRS